MIRLQVGASSNPRMGDELVRVAQNVQRLLGDSTFQLVMTEAADDIAARWSSAPDASAREGLWHNLQGLQKLLGFMQGLVEQGTRAARSEGPAAKNTPSTN